jgi:acyl-CoA reductase-like NAD-dependent aldehyde dehydrogenase
LASHGELLRSRAYVDGAWTNDADIDVAVKGVLTAKCGNAGLACIAANRIFVQRGIHDAFAARSNIWAVRESLASNGKRSQMALL